MLSNGDKSGKRDVTKPSLTSTGADVSRGVEVSTGESPRGWSLATDCARQSQPRTVSMRASRRSSSDRPSDDGGPPLGPEGSPRRGSDGLRWCSRRSVHLRHSPRAPVAVAITERVMARAGRGHGDTDRRERAGDTRANVAATEIEGFVLHPKFGRRLLRCHRHTKSSPDTACPGPPGAQFVSLAWRTRRGHC